MFALERKWPGSGVTLSIIFYSIDVVRTVCITVVPANTIFTLIF